ncbi:MAG: amino acid ABC transporter substrate-binding protein [Castellaniella sp.]|uniref:amino acid ABC transporter substrate-binding protein n=1 Tax=Castellaniella sp. TaxID=1955812 RepID=UPI0011F4CBDA|nr:amino acid ABC transporter substrate-binding protein [Castellaniella sp.]TAN31118.1 MAG: amino acid ABC transporter substrate-binding protein [Castellaniella sp.]
MKKLKSLLVAGLLPLLSLALPGAASAATDDLAAIQKAGVIRIGTEGTYAPFSFHETSDNKLVGFDVDIGRAIAKQLGVKAEFVEGKWDGLIAGLNVNRYDAVINNVGITPEREAKYTFSKPYVSSEAVLIVRSDNTSIHSFDDLKGKTSANTISSNFGQLAQRHGAKVVPVQGFNDAIALLTSGRVDATVNDNLSFLDFKKHQPKAKVKVVASDSSGDFGRSGVLLRKDQPALKAAVDKAISTIIANGTYKKISDRYFGEDLSSKIH